MGESSMKEADGGGGGGDPRSEGGGGRDSLRGATAGEEGGGDDIAEVDALGLSDGDLLEVHLQINQESAKSKNYST